MRGVVIKKAQIIAEDQRRKIVSILNGELTGKDVHILFMKKGDVGPLGNHYHTYKEACYCLKGKAHYKLKHELTGEELDTDLNEGEVMYRDAFVTHTCICTDDCILIDIAQESWIGEEWNHYKPKENLM